jgi:hypothetical protein
MATWQGLLVIALAIAAAVWLFLLKLKPPQIVVPSLTLWRVVLDQGRDRSLWDRIRKAVSLVLAILITLAIALALLRPQAGSPAGASVANANHPAGDARSNARVAIVLDSSWSMLASTSNGSTRWDRAVARARALASGAGGEEVVLATTADGVVEGPTPDVSLIEAALDRIGPSGGNASGLSRDLYGAGTTYFITDGALARSLGDGVVVESVFEAADNVAITAFDVRAADTLDSGGQAFLSVANYATVPQTVRIAITRGNASVLDVQVPLGAGESQQRIVPLDRSGDARLRARVSAKANALVVDDEAVAWIPGVQPLRLTVVSNAPSVFGPLLADDPAIAPTFVSPANYTPGREELVIFDRTLPAAPSKVPALFIATAAVPPIKTRGLQTLSTPDLTAGVDLMTMTFDAARRYSADDLSAVAFSPDPVTMTDGRSERAPLVYVHDEPEQRFVLFTFSVVDSKMMFAPGFPVLMKNAIDWLAHPVPPGTRAPGPATFEGTFESVVGPDGQPVPLTRIGKFTVVPLSHTGFYEARAGNTSSTIAVNAGDPDISDLQRTRLPEALRTAAATSSASRGRPWWLVAAVLGLLLIAAEWFTWQRRITV